MNFKKLSLNIDVYKLAIPICLMVISCEPSTSRNEVAVYQAHCSTCHLAPSIDDLSKIWQEKNADIMVLENKLFK